MRFGRAREALSRISKESKSRSDPQTGGQLTVNNRVVSPEQQSMYDR